MILVCNVEPFNHYQDVYLVNNEEAIISDVGKIKLTALYSFIPAYCYDNNIEKVRLCGNAQYNEGIKNQIEMVEETQFSDRKKLIVEVA